MFLIYSPSTVEDKNLPLSSYQANGMARPSLSLISSVKVPNHERLSRKASCRSPCVIMIIIMDMPTQLV